MLVHRTIVVPSEFVEPARFACEKLAGSGGSGMFSVPLSPTGENPPTHFTSHGNIEEEFAFLLSNPEYLRSVLEVNGMNPDEILYVLSVSDISDEFSETVFPRLNLKVVSE